MIKYISKWYQGIVKTPKPDVEEAVEDLRIAIQALNEAVEHLESIKGVYGYIDISHGYSRNIVRFDSDTGPKFHANLDYVAEHHRREF